MKRKNAIELETLLKMIALYCRGRHGGERLCASCAKLAAGAAERLARCPHDPKPACRDCRTHCYPPELRAQIRAVMRYAGPRMPLRHPLLALRHWLGF